MACVSSSPWMTNCSMLGMSRQCIHQTCEWRGCCIHLASARKWGHSCCMDQFGGCVELAAQRLTMSGREGRRVHSGLSALREIQLSLMKCSHILSHQREALPGGGCASHVLCLTQPLCFRYRVVVEGERGNRPHIYCLEQLLQEAVCAAKAACPRCPWPALGWGRLAGSSLLLQLQGNVPCHP